MDRKKPEPFEPGCVDNTCVEANDFIFAHVSMALSQKRIADALTALVALAEVVAGEVLPTLRDRWPRDHA